jgi:iron(II)-dependent oxidoreductase
LDGRLGSPVAGVFLGWWLWSGVVAAQPETRTNETDGSVLVLIPGGEFRMGSDEGDPDEQPVHTVRVESFWLGQHEVTNEQYGRFMAATQRDAPPFWDDPKLNQPSQPVVGVKWLAAVAYCKWAGLRLPTEAEWEYAAAAGARELPYGTSTGECTPELANYGGVEGRAAGESGPRPVGTFPPNPFGLYDLAGNAWEWCSSAWQPYPYKADDGREDLAGGLKVMRGGCWHFGPFTCRRACRHRHAAHLMYDYAGFRVALHNTPETGSESP